MDNYTEYIEKLLSAFFQQSNCRYISNAILRASPNGIYEAEIGGIVLPVTSANMHTIELYEKYHMAYHLSEEDFSAKAIEPTDFYKLMCEDWLYKFQLVGFSEPKNEDDKFAGIEILNKKQAVEWISSRFHLEKSRIPIVIFGEPINMITKTLLEGCKEQGYKINYIEQPMR